MATRLDQQIELLGNIVDQRLDLCSESYNGMRCTLAANHSPREAHSFAVNTPAASYLEGAPFVSNMSSALSKRPRSFRGKADRTVYP